MQTRPQTAIVIGGGVAGIAAAVALSEAGLRVELVEKRPLLGGRASSFIEHGTGERLDVCQHGTMRCCTNLADLLDRLGAHQNIRYLDTLEFIGPDGTRSSICSSPLPAPFHTSLSFARFRLLSVRDKIAIARGLMRILRTPASAELDRSNMADWLRRSGQTPRAVARFWRPILLSACNDEPEQIATVYGFKIFRDGFLTHRSAFHFGIPKVPLGTLYTEPAIAFLKARGSCARLRDRVRELRVDR
ncbi:MAG TPA: FAD-dependent oxidoreductase, partial [Chthonomonadales bacterium]|nr:FAD-dependent oxidoreductase [Chthonomonadales bacterium]